MSLNVSQFFFKWIKYLLVGYAILSLAFTGHELYTLRANRHAHAVIPLVPRTNEQHVVGTHRDGHAPEPLRPEHTTDSKTTAADVSWLTNTDASRTLPEPYVLSKLFSDAIRPTHLTPFFHRANATFDMTDITLATLVTRDRFKVLSRLASHYQGPISAAVHVTDDGTKDEVLQELHTTIAQNPNMQMFVDIHLVVDPFDRQFNLWRNIAKFFSRTDYIMMLDIDFHVCTNFRLRIQNSPDVMELLASGKTALVVPAFEYVSEEEGLDAKTFPITKQALIHKAKEGKIDMFHKAWPNGHGATNYTRWYESTDTYTVTDYQYSYEPYVIYKKQDSPWCDERFIGYGANKAACLYEMYLSGIEFKVLPFDFLIHQSHAYPEETRKMERQYNRKLYANFREEVCFRYARQFYATGEWGTPLTENLMKECSKIRGFRTSMRKQTA